MTTLEPRLVTVPDGLQTEESHTHKAGGQPRRGPGAQRAQVESAYVGDAYGPTLATTG